MIDITFDFRSDTPADKDPDKLSPTLRRYHKLLWSKPLPNGAPFDLSVTHSGAYLYHRSSLGEFTLTSDGAITTFWKDTSLKPVFATIPGEFETFKRASYTIGGMIVFPGKCVNGQMTINGARGFNRKIRDRFDLTVECIRRYYRNEPSPLQDVLARYAPFFALFGDFEGYVRHFLLQDLVTTDCSSVNFFMPFHDFPTQAIPKGMDAYMAYRHLAMEFIAARGQRIMKFASQLSA